MINSEMKTCNFEVTWERVKKVTGWSDYKELAAFVGSTSQSVSGVKKRGKFPIEWAFKIAHAFGSSTDWLLADQSDADKYMMAEELQSGQVSGDPRSVYISHHHTDTESPELSAVQLKISAVHFNMKSESERMRFLSKLLGTVADSLDEEEGTH